MVDSNCSRGNRAEHLCAAGESGPRAFVLAVAANARCDLVNRKSRSAITFCGVFFGLVGLWCWSVHSSSTTSICLACARFIGINAVSQRPWVPHAGALQPCASPNHAWLHHCVLGDATHDAGTSDLRSRDDGLHSDRDSTGGTRPRQPARTNVRRLPPSGFDAAANSETRSLGHRLNARRPSLSTTGNSQE